MSIKKRYESDKAWKAFNALEKPAFLDKPEWKALLEKNRQEQDSFHKRVMNIQGGHWGANNKAKGAKVANAGINDLKHTESISKARILLVPYKDRLCIRGVAGIISRTTQTPESTVRRYINLLKENPQDQ